MTLNKCLQKTIKPIIAFLIIMSFGCKKTNNIEEVEINYSYLDFSQNSLDYRITPKDAIDKSGLIFSDQGAWFAYSLPKTNKNIIGFSGPFLMTQQNGVWSSASLSNLKLTYGNHSESLVDLKKIFTTKTATLVI